LIKIIFSKWLNNMITNVNLDKYKANKIKTSFDTEIRELSDENYNYIPGPIITSIYPNGGEKLWTRDFLIIKWNKEQDSLMSEVSIDLILNDKNNINIAQSVPNNGSHTWRIPINVRSEKCKIRIYGRYDSTNYEMISENYFEIDRRYIEIEDNNIKEIVANVGDIYNLTWIHNGEGNNFKIELFNSKNNSLNKIIENNYYIKDGDPLIYDWEILGIEPYIISTCKIKITNIAKPDIFGYTKAISLKVPFIYGLDIPFHTLQSNIELDDNFTRKLRSRIYNLNVPDLHTLLRYIQFTPESKTINTDGASITLDPLPLGWMDNDNNPNNPSTGPMINLR